LENKVTQLESLIFMVGLSFTLKVWVEPIAEMYTIALLLK